MSIIFAKEVNQGIETGGRVFEPLVDYNPGTGEIYIPRYDTKAVLRAHEDGESRGYLAQGMKMVYVPYPIYQELKEQLSALLEKIAEIQHEMNGLNISGHRDVPLWQFMLNNASMLYGAGAKLMLRDVGGCRVITDKEYAALLQADDESEEEDDIYGEECPEDDVPDEDPEEDGDEEPEEQPRHIRITIYPHPSTDE